MTARISPRPTERVTPSTIRRPPISRVSDSVLRTISFMSGGGLAGGAAASDRKTRVLRSRGL